MSVIEACSERRAARGRAFQIGSADPDAACVLENAAFFPNARWHVETSDYPSTSRAVARGRASLIAR